MTNTRMPSSSSIRRMCSCAQPAPGLSSRSISHRFIHRRGVHCEQSLRQIQITHQGTLIEWATNVNEVTCINFAYFILSIRLLDQKYDQFDLIVCSIHN